MISNIFKSISTSKKVATNEKRKEEGGGGEGGGAKQEGENSAGREEKKVGSARRVMKKLGQKLGGMLGGKKERKDRKKPQSISSSLSSVSIQADLVQQLEIAFQGPYEHAMDAGSHLLESIARTDEDLATDINEGILRVMDMEKEGIASVEEYLSWVVAGLESGKWQREEEGSLNGWAFVVSKIIPILSAAVQALKSAPSSFDVLLFATQLQLLDPESGFFLLRTFERVDKTDEEKIELIEDAIEDLEVTVRVFYSRASSSAHLIKDSFCIGLPPSSSSSSDAPSSFEPYAIERQLMDSYSSIGSGVPDSTVSEQIDEVERVAQRPTLRRTKKRTVWSSEELVVAESNSTTEEEEEETSELEEELDTPGLERVVVEAWWVVRK